MRFKNSLINSIVSSVMYIVTILIGLIAQRVFIRVLGNEYLGINALFTNIISVLAIVELGFGSAIIYNLYKPIAENDTDQVHALIQFYKKVYNIIAVVVFILGLCILPFLNIIVGKVSIDENIYIIFLMFIFDTVASYLLTYKRSIFYADQKTYFVNLIHILYVLLMNGVDIILLFVYKNFYIYLSVKIVFRILENIIITILANKMYPYLKQKHVSKVNRETKQGIVRQVKGLFFHQIATAIINGSDNIVISMTPSLGVITVGVYSNYSMIISAVFGLVSQVYSSITASVGNLLTKENKDRSYKVFKNMLLLNSWMMTFVSISILCMIEPFITICFAKSYVLQKSVLITLVINLYIQGVRMPYGTFKNAAGIFYEDRFVPVIESIVNITFSLILVRYFGLAGVFMGTIVSVFILFCYSYPYFVYKIGFNKSYLQYVIDCFKYIIISVLCAAVTYLVTSLIKPDKILLQLLVNAVVCLIIPNVIYYLSFRNTEEMKYCKSIIMSIKEKILGYVQVYRHIERNV